MSGINKILKVANYLEVKYAEENTVNVENSFKREADTFLKGYLNRKYGKDNFSISSDWNVHGPANYEIGNGPYPLYYTISLGPNISFDENHFKGWLKVFEKNMMDKIQHLQTMFNYEERQIYKKVEDINLYDLKNDPKEDFKIRIHVSTRSSRAPK